MEQATEQKQLIAPICYTTVEAALYIGVCKSVLDRARSTGELAGCRGPEFIRIGKKTIRYRKADLDKWIENLPSYTTLSQEYVYGCTA